MKSIMKSLTFVLLAAFVSVVSIHAQEAQQKPTKSAEEMANKQTEMMVKELALTPQQEAKVKEINLNYAQKFKAARADKENGKAQMKELLKSKDAEMKAVLTAEQYQLWREKQKEKAEQRKAKEDSKKKDK